MLSDKQDRNDSVRSDQSSVSIDTGNNPVSPQTSAAPVAAPAASSTESAAELATHSATRSPDSDTVTQAFDTPAASDVSRDSAADSIHEPIPSESVSEETAETQEAPTEPLGMQIGMMVGWAALACLLTLINRFAGAVVPLPRYDSPLGHLIATLYLAPLLLSLLQTARIAVMLPVSAALLSIIGLILALPSLGVVFITLTKINIPVLTYFYGILPGPLQSLLNNFFGPIGLSLLGAAIGRVIRHPNTLLAAAGFSIFFDIVVVTMGTVAQLMRSGSNLIAAVSVGAGAAPRALPGAPQVKLPDPISGVTIGPADVLFIALFLSAVYFLKRTWTAEPLEKRDAAWRDTLRWMYGLLLLALVLVEFFGLPIPALVPMGIAVLIGNARLAAFTPTEKRDLVIGGVFAIFCAGLMILWAQRTIPPAPPNPGFELAQDPNTGRVFILGTEAESPAARAGLRKGDEILAINDQPMKGFTDADLMEALEKAREDGMRLRIQRRGEREPLAVTLRFTDEAAKSKEQ
ncbi:MAG: hypothetical protein OHK0029_14570 [Armatimonadaceae bacterium]